MSQQKGLLLAALTVLTLTLSSTVIAFEWQYPYLGIDAQWRRADFKGGFGDNLFAHTYPYGISRNILQL